MTAAQHIASLRVLLADARERWLRDNNWQSAQRALEQMNMLPQLAELLSPPISDEDRRALNRMGVFTPRTHQTNAVCGNLCEGQAGADLPTATSTGQRSSDVPDTIEVRRDLVLTLARFFNGWRTGDGASKAAIEGDLFTTAGALTDLGRAARDLAKSHA